MKALINTATSQILIFSDSPDFGGPWGHGLQDGTLKLVPIPDGERIDELVLQGGVVAVDAVKKAARIAKDIAKAERKERLKNHDATTANSIVALRAIVVDLLAELRGD